MILRRRPCACSKLGIGIRSVEIALVALLRRVCHGLDALAPKLGVWRRDDHSVPGRLEGIEQVVCEAKRLVEPKAGDGDVDQKASCTASSAQRRPCGSPEGAPSRHGSGRGFPSRAGQVLERGGSVSGGLWHGRSRKLVVSPGPHDGITGQRLRKRRPLRHLAHRQLGPVAALRTGYPQLGTHPGDVAAGHLELLGDLDHWRRPNQLVELLLVITSVPIVVVHPSTGVMTRPRSVLWRPWLAMNRRRKPLDFARPGAGRTRRANREERDDSGPGSSRFRASSHARTRSTGSRNPAWRGDRRRKKGLGDHPSPRRWWSRRELNPRPQAITGQFYMLSCLIWVLTARSRSSTLPSPPVT